MQTFDITLKNEKEGTYRFIILLLVILHSLVFTWLCFDEKLWKIGAAGLVITTLYSGYRWLITNTNKQRFSFGSGYFMVITLINIEFYMWFYVIEFILLILSTIALTPLVLSFTSHNVKKLHFPSKKYRWDQFSNVDLKDNLLTLDFKNNRLLQAVIATTHINEEAFNIFAQQQLNK